MGLTNILLFTSTLTSASDSDSFEIDTGFRDGPEWDELAVTDFDFEWDQAPEMGELSVPPKKRIDFCQRDRDCFRGNQCSRSGGFCVPSEPSPNSKRDLNVFTQCIFFFQQIFLDRDASNLSAYSPEDFSFLFCMIPSHFFVNDCIM